MMYSLSKGKILYCNPLPMGQVACGIWIQMSLSENLFWGYKPTAEQEIRVEDPSFPLPLSLSNYWL